MRDKTGQCIVVPTQNSSILSVEQAKASHFKGLSMLANANANADIMFITFILFHEGGNGNGDYVTRDEMENMWHTFAGKPITWEHGEPYIGFITDSMLHKPAEDSPDPRWYVECGGVIWKARYPAEASAVLEGVQHGTYRMSFEIYFKQALYMLGDDQSNLYTAEEAPYLVPLVGREYMGQKVWRVLIDCLGGGAGVTRNPADVDALILTAASERTPVDVQVDYEKCVAHITSIETLVEEVKEMDKLEKKLEKLNEEVASLNETVATLRQEKEELEQTKASLEEQLAEFEATKTEFEAYKEQAEAEKEELEQRLATLQEEFDAYKAQIEHEKAEAAKDALAAERLAELKAGGVAMDEEQEAKWTARLREMDDEAFADLKELLVANTATDPEDETTPETTAPEAPEAGTVTASRTALASLNLESVNTTLAEKFEKLWENILSND